MENNLELCFTYFQRNDFHLLIGKIHYFDAFARELRILDYHNELHKLKLDDLVDVKFH